MQLYIIYMLIYLLYYIQLLGGVMSTGYSV